MNDTSTFRSVLKWGRRIGIAIAGGLVVFVGVVMIVAPGPAFVVIPLGLGILSLEFETPRRWLVHIKRKAAEVAAATKTRMQKRKKP